MTEELDDLDCAILKELVNDCRVSSRNLADRLNKSPTTISNRIKKLEEIGIINNYGVQLNYQNLGFDWTVITNVVVSKGKLIETENEIAKLPHVLAVYDVTGETDIIVIGRFQTREQLSIFTKSLLAMEFVDRTNSHIALNTIKEDFNLRNQVEKILSPNLLTITK
ncbi:MAG: Lrp/AsnC family transcriptional regulator [Candidatus Hodarchaeales archaeon]|jgi:DNA-binding Lrp family transcriptional regulator